MGMTLYSSMRPIAQMSQNFNICMLKLAVVACCLVLINVATGVSLVIIRLLLF